MTLRHSTARPSVAKPQKPYPDFPLTWHPSGYWCKKIRGKLHYFGSRNATPQVAEVEYNRVREDLYAGREPRVNIDGLTVRDLANHFLTDRQHRLDAGELKQRTFEEYRSSCERIVTSFGKTRLVDDLRSEDFLALRDQIAKVWGTVRLSNEIQRVRTIFKFALDSELVDRPVRFGPTFKKPNKRVLRLHRAKKGKRLFTPDQIHLLLGSASQQMKAMVLLAVNAGFGNSDCGQLQFSHLNLEAGWFDYPRRKTGVERRGKLWSETVAALKGTIACRPEPKNDEHKSLVFITKQRLSWFKDTPDNPVSKEYRKLADETKVYRPGLAFYALRHTFETIAGDSGDQVAVDYIMGHVDQSTAETYREQVFNPRLERVADHVHSWLYASRVEG